MKGVPLSRDILMLQTVSISSDKEITNSHLEVDFLSGFCWQFDGKVNRLHEIAWRKCSNPLVFFQIPLVNTIIPKLGVSKKRQYIFTQQMHPKQTHQKYKLERQ